MLAALLQNSKAGWMSPLGVELHGPNELNKLKSEEERNAGMGSLSRT